MRGPEYSSEFSAGEPAFYSWTWATTPRHDLREANSNERDKAAPNDEKRAVVGINSSHQASMSPLFGVHREQGARAVTAIGGAVEMVIDSTEFPGLTSD